MYDNYCKSEEPPELHPWQELNAFYYTRDMIGMTTTSEIDTTYPTEIVVDKAKTKAKTKAKNKSGTRKTRIGTLNS